MHNMLEKTVKAAQCLGEAISDLARDITLLTAMINEAAPFLEAEADAEAERRAWAMADRDNYVRGQLRQRIYHN